jgi:hypothetical protein
MGLVEVLLLVCLLVLSTGLIFSAAAALNRRYNHRRALERVEKTAWNRLVAELRIDNN